MIRRILTLAFVALLAVAGPAAAQYDPGSGCGSVSITNPASVDADGTAVVAAGGDAAVSLSNMLPGSTVTVTVGGLTVASFTVPASGVLAGSFQIPAGLGEGTYSVVASGTDANGNACGASTAVRVDAGGTDGGGDGGDGGDNGSGSISVPSPDSVDTDGTPVVSVGDSINVTRTGLLPGSTLTITLNGAVVETVIVPASGDVNASIAVPTGTYAGRYTVAAAGTNADGSTNNSSLVVRVAAANQNAGGTTGGTTGGTDPSGSLAFTGSTAGPLAGAATVLIVLGAVMLQARKPEASDS